MAQLFPKQANGLSQASIAAGAAAGGTVLPDICCGMCKDACERMPELAKTRQSGRLKWLDSVVAERATGKVTIHARYLEPDQRIDAAELMGAMDEIGLPPFSLKIVMSAEEQASAPPIR